MLPLICPGEFQITVWKRYAAFVEIFSADEKSRYPLLLSRNGPTLYI
jgi:hypothetical protein